MLLANLQQLYRKFLKKCISEVDREMAKSSMMNGEVIGGLHKKRCQLKKALASVHSTICWNKP
jgi:hypothetical protein